MKKSCLYFDKKIQMCILHSPLQRSYLKACLFYAYKFEEKTVFVTKKILEKQNK